MDSVFAAFIDTVEYNMITKDLLAILACPQCKGALQLQGEEGLLCERCLLLYEIRDDIPIMLIDQAKKVDKPKG